MARPQIIAISLFAILLAVIGVATWTLARHRTVLPPTPVRPKTLVFRRAPASRPMISEWIRDQFLNPFVYRPKMGGIVSSPQGQPFPASVVTWPVCSATLVGAEVLLFAAHCLDPDYERASLEIPTQQTFEGPCDRIEKWDANGTLMVDLALCALETPVPDVRFETLANVNETVAIGDDVLLTGYAESGTLQGQFVIGKTTVTGIETARLITGPQAFTSPGDSGAGVYKMFGNDRRLIAVNSLVTARVSTATLVGAAMNEIRQWQSTTAARLPTQDLFICGLDHNERCQPKEHP